MTVQDLIIALERYPGDAEVRLAIQPSWPFECSIAGLTDNTEIADPDDEGAPDDEGVTVVYIAEGSQLGYASKRIWDAAC